MATTAGHKEHLRGLEAGAALRKGNLRNEKNRSCMMGKTRTFICVLAEVAVIAGMAGYYFGSPGKTRATCEYESCTYLIFSR